MPLSPSLPDIALRIILTIIAGALVGFERGERGKAAGLRTTILVGLAACFAMVLANLLLDTTGKKSDSFATMDVMRMALGILTGVGFIGGGAILQRQNSILGVTTAATMWFMTVVGLCFGAGAIWLGIAGAVCGVVIVQLLHIVEMRLRRDRRATLTIEWDRDKLDREALEQLVVKPPFELSDCRSQLWVQPYAGKLEIELRWRARGTDRSTPEIVEQLAATDGVRFVSWQPSSGNSN